MTVPDRRRQAEWRKSTYSNQESACVEVVMGEVVGVRDTKDRAAGHITVPDASWKALLERI